MDKKTIKAILDVIKDVKERAGLWGAQFTAHEHVSEASYVYFTDGYMMVRLECGEYDGLLPINEDMWVGGEQLKEAYKNTKGKDMCLTLKNEEREHADLPKMWGELTKELRPTSVVAIDPTIFKKLAPFGQLAMFIVEGDKKLVLFKGRGIKAVVAPLTKQVEEELCKLK